MQVSFLKPLSLHNLEENRSSFTVIEGTYTVVHSFGLHIREEDMFYSQNFRK